MKIPDYDEVEYNEERLARFEVGDTWPVDVDSLDPAVRHVWVYECWLDEHGRIMEKKP